MNLSHLLSDAQDAGGVNGDFQVLLATRRLDGVDVPPDEVKVRAVGRLQVDPSGEEVDFFLCVSGAGGARTDGCRLPKPCPDLT
jgi:hypothetical protein